MKPRTAEEKIIPLDKLVKLREAWRREEKTVAWTNGCFDLLHVGHIRSIQEARKHGDLLIVGVNGDASVRKLKGPERPMVPAAERMLILASIEAVDYVVEFDGESPAEVLLLLKPDVNCKGADYKPPHGKVLPEADAIKAYGGRVVYLPLITERSTTNLIRQIRVKAGKSGEGR